MRIDLCIVGSGAGASPVAYELAKAGFKVIVLEKGPWYKAEHFTKDEMVVTRKDAYIPNLKDEKHVVVKEDDEGKWKAKSTEQTGHDLWNGNCVGGSSNFMSGYFHRLKPNDFKPLSTFGPIEGANIVDWPITYKDLEPYYEKVEREIGVSGKVVNHPAQEPRSTTDFPYPPLGENVVSSLIDEAAKELDIATFPTPRAILSKPKDNRKSCYYSNYCGSYGCSSDAKGSGRAALLNDAVNTGNCTIIPHAKVFHLTTNGKGKIVVAKYYDHQNQIQTVEAKLFVVAAQAVETSRLLLMSKNEDCPNGLSNNQDLVGKNLLFSAGGVGSGYISYENLDSTTAEQLKIPGLFVNRATQQWYTIEDTEFGDKPFKGGTVDFLFDHANPVSKAVKQKWDGSRLLYGSALKTKLKSYYTEGRRLKFEVFNDWLPNEKCFVELDDKVLDKWGDPVGKVWVGNHPHDIKVGKYIAKKTSKILEKMGAENVSWSISGSPAVNLMAGGCRFGNDPTTSVLDKNCKSHEIENLYITDGSFMPTGGSVTYTFTIYANAFRIADKIIEDLRSEA